MNEAESPPDIDWVIVGGGIHGVHLAVSLLARGGVEPSRLRILDPGAELLDEWRRCTSNTGMRHLRSPAVHHLDINPWSLLDFGGANRRGKGAARGTFVAPYHRPTVELFEAHCREVIEQHGLEALHVKDRAIRLDVSDREVTLSLESGATVKAAQALLALGAGQFPRWPDWALALRDRGVQVHHLFEHGFRMQTEHWGPRVAVVGGGISAVQAALRFAEAGKTVHLVSRHPLRSHQFDSDPGWVGPKNMRRFSATRSVDARRQMIREARHTGSVPPDLYKAIQRAIRHDAVQWHLGEVSVTLEDTLQISVDNQSLKVDGLLLATGFASHRPGGSLVDTLANQHALPCSTCGYPIVDTHLRWHPRVFVTGALAELEIGPVARNIVGARRAAERIIPLVLRQSASHPHRAR